MEIVDKNDARIKRDDFHTFISLLDQDGRFLTGIGVSKEANGEIMVHFPSGTVDLDSEYNMKPNHIDGEPNPDHIAVRIPGKRFC